jgi:hypothetical protein
LDESGVEGGGDNARVLEAAGELVAEQDVHELGVAVGGKVVVGLVGRFKVVCVDTSEKYKVA